MYQTIIEKAESVTPEMIAYRRDFHKYAESGWLEMRTASIIARRLTELGYEVLMGDAVCKTDARLGVPSEEVLEKNYNRALGIEDEEDDSEEAEETEETNEN